MTPSEMTIEQLFVALDPLARRMTRFADMYDLRDYGSLTREQLDQQARETYEEMRPIYNEIARRFPHDHEIQQMNRDFKRYAIRFTPTREGY